jgi:phenylalanyl-tRNA synthetase alpha chain
MMVVCHHDDCGAKQTRCYVKWIEIGNSGMFRPEMLRPMGLPENVRVIAWGLSLERYESTCVSLDELLSLHQERY